jgi:hypothetical protein
MEGVLTAHEVQPAKHMGVIRGFAWKTPTVDPELLVLPFVPRRARLKGKGGPRAERGDGGGRRDRRGKRFAENTECRSPIGEADTHAKPVANRGGLAMVDLQRVLRSRKPPIRRNAP